MSFVSAMIISSDCAESELEKLRKVYGISLKEINSPGIRNQLESEQRFYILNNSDTGYFWDNWTPIGAGGALEKAKEMLSKKCVDECSKIVDQWEMEFNLRYTAFEAQIYQIIIRHLKLGCNVKEMGIVGFMMHEDFQFPTFHKKTVLLKDLDADVIYGMPDNCIYYFE